MLPNIDYNNTMRKVIGTGLGKAVRGLTKLRGTGGQALPGLVVERLLPGYLAAMLAQLPDGIVVVTGTNGKTTTTKIIVELLRLSGKRVLTNPTGSNFTRGIVASLTQQASLGGKLPFDIGVFELDEAYAVQFVSQVRPHWVLALNVMRDQLDRFGELDTAARLIGATMQQATEGVVVNGDDARLVAHAASLNNVKVVTFGVEPDLRKFFPVDDELVAVEGTPTKPRPTGDNADVTLTAFNNQHVSFRLGTAEYSATLQLTGQHNFQNAAAALALVRALLSGRDEQLVQQLSSIAPAFGRGERFTLKDGSTLELILIKNPAGFRQTLASYPVAKVPTLIAINDNYADSRDVSWLWDADLSSLKARTVTMTSGSRAADMAMRLNYDDVKVGQVQPDVKAALHTFCHQKGDKMIVTTYTAMLEFYKLLKKGAGKTL
jgi:lipid II isoglutaminyl synthase (glutamine-hydrolysing)